MTQSALNSHSHLVGRMPCGLASWVAGPLVRFVSKRICITPRGSLSHTGLRVNKAANLKLEDIDLKKQFLTARLAKWGKDWCKPVPITAILLDT